MHLKTATIEINFNQMSTKSHHLLPAKYVSTSVTNNVGSTFLEKLIESRRVKKFTLSYRTRRFITLLARNWFSSSYGFSSRSPILFYHVPFNAALPSTPRFSKRSLSHPNLGVHLLSVTGSPYVMLITLTTSCSQLQPVVTSSILA